MKVHENKSFSELPITNQLLIEGLLELMEKERFVDITITKLCDYSKVGRKTYYRHFASKYEILILYLGLLMEESIQEVSRSEAKDLEELLAIYFTYWKTQENLIKLLRKHQICYLMVSGCERFLESDKASNIFDRKGISHLESIFIFIGATRVLQKWIYEEIDFTAKDLASQLVQSFKHMTNK